MLAETVKLTGKKISMAEQRNLMRKNILLAFDRLLQESSYSEIGVNRICSEAHISKPTFYRYFRSREDIVYWVSRKAIGCGVAEIGRRYTWAEAYNRTLTVIDRYRTLFTDPKSPAQTNPLHTFCGEYVKLELCKTLTKYKGIALTERLCFQVETFAQMHSNLLQQWGARMMPLTRQTYADYLSSIVPIELYTTLDKPQVLSYAK